MMMTHRHGRRAAAANKLSRFFGCNTSAFFEDLIRSLELGVKEEVENGTLLEDEERGLMRSLGELRRRVGSTSNGVVGRYGGDMRDVQEGAGEEDGRPM